jgi:hypothetical protein
MVRKSSLHRKSILSFGKLLKPFNTLTSKESSTWDAFFRRYPLKQSGQKSGLFLAGLPPLARFDSNLDSVGEIVPPCQLQTTFPWRGLEGETANDEKAILYALLIAAGSCFRYTCSSACFGLLLH